MTLKLVMRPRREQVMFCSKYILKLGSIDDARENPGSPHDCRVWLSCRRSPRHREIPVAGVMRSLRSPCSATDEWLQLAGSRGSKYSPKAADGKLGIGEGQLSDTAREGQRPAKRRRWPAGGISVMNVSTTSVSRRSRSNELLLSRGHYAAVRTILPPSQSGAGLRS